MKVHEEPSGAAVECPCAECEARRVAVSEAMREVGSLPEDEEVCSEA